MKNIIIIALMLPLLNMVRNCGEGKYFETTDTIYLYKQQPHTCNWTICYLRGQSIFKSPFNKMGDNRYQFDLLHFQNPSLSMEEIQDLYKKKLTTIVL